MRGETGKAVNGIIYRWRKAKIIFNVQAEEFHGILPDGTVVRSPLFQKCLEKVKRHMKSNTNYERTEVYYVEGYGQKRLTPGVTTSETENGNVWVSFPKPEEHRPGTYYRSRGECSPKNLVPTDQVSKAFLSHLSNLEAAIQKREEEVKKLEDAIEKMVEPLPRYQLQWGGGDEEQ